MQIVLRFLFLLHCIGFLTMHINFPQKKEENDRIVFAHPSHRERQQKNRIKEIYSKT